MTACIRTTASTFEEWKTAIKGKWMRLNCHFTVLLHSFTKRNDKHSSHSHYNWTRRKDGTTKKKDKMHQKPPADFTSALRRSNHWLDLLLFHKVSTAEQIEKE